MAKGMLEQIESIRPHLEGISLKQMISGDVDVKIVSAVIAVVQQMRSEQWLPTDVIILTFAQREIEREWDVTHDQLRRWCVHNLGDADFMPLFLIGFSILVFSPDLGVWRAVGEVNRRCRDLVFDDDGLLIGGDRKVEFTKAGVLVESYCLKYSPLLRQYNLHLSGGFLERLMALRRLSPTRFGLAIDPDIVLDKKFHLPLMTKAFIRGPRGLSHSMLQDDSFPEDRSGTVTEHERVPMDVVTEYMGPDFHKFQVMWSSHDNIKTVQIEELVPLDARQFARESHVMNRYVHAQWDPQKGHFVHFDGAVRIYEKERYNLRLRADLKRRDAKTRADEYHKLFRVDCELSIDIWCQLVARFYYQNELAIEYLGGQAGGPFAESEFRDEDV